MLISYHLGQGSIVLRVKIRNSSVSTGAGLTGLTSASTGLIISTIADNEASPTTYTVAGSTIETITTLGTYAAPTATKCRFKEVSSTNHPGIYELQIADARFAVSSAKSLLVSISGATNAAECDALIPLTTVDPYSTTYGITGNVPADAKAINGVATSSVTTVNANVGTTQPVNFTGTGASALAKSDMVDIAGAAVSTSTAQLGVNVVNIGGSASVGNAGYVGIDWAHVLNPTTAVGLSGTTIATSQAITSVSGAVGSVTGNVGGSVVGDVQGKVLGGGVSALSGVGVQADLQTIKTQTVTCAAGVTVGAFVGNATHAIVVDSSGNVTFNNTTIGVSGDLTSTMKTSVENAVWDGLTSAHATAGSFGVLIKTDLDATVSSRLATSGYTSPPTAASIATAVWTDTTASDFTTSSSPGAILVGASGIESSVSLKQALQRIGATVAGKLSGSETNTEVFVGLDGTTTRVTITTDSSGNRTAITYA